MQTATSFNHIYLGSITNKFVICIGINMNEENQNIIITPKVQLKIDVNRIVKYACITAVCVVGIIFGTNIYKKMLKETHKSN